MRRTPDAVAVVYDGAVADATRSSTRRANQLAHYLRRTAWARISWSAICVERSLEMVVGLLGILKAGGAYVPLDPELSGGAAAVHAGGQRRRGCC